VRVKENSISPIGVNMLLKSESKEVQPMLGADLMIFIQILLYAHGARERLHEAP